RGCDGRATRPGTLRGATPHHPEIRRPAPSSCERLVGPRRCGRHTQFTLDELDELLDRLETAVYRAKGNEKQKALRIMRKVAGLLGSEIIPSHVSTHQTSEKASAIFQIKMTLKGIDPPIWRRIHTPDCTLEELHEIIQVTMGWESDHLYRFTI